MGPPSPTLSLCIYLLPKGFYKNRISARSVLKCFPFETRARLKSNAPATVSRDRPFGNVQISPSPRITSTWGFRMADAAEYAQERFHRLFFISLEESFFTKYKFLSFIFNILIYILSGRPIKTNFILEKEFQFHYYLFMDDEETGSVPSPVKLLPRNRYRSREVVGPASQPDADPPPRKQSFGIRQRNFLIHGCFSASRVLIAFSSPKERECKDKTVSSWSTS